MRSIDCGQGLVCIVGLTVCAAIAAALPPWPFSPAYPTVRYESWPRPRSVVFADIDQANGVDMIDAESDANIISVRLNNGVGFFWTWIWLPAAGEPMDVFAGDVDGDLDMDIVSANRIGDSVSVFLNIGGGNFAPRIDYPAGDGARALVLADVDGDSDADIVVVNEHASTVSVLINNGSGVFGPPTSYAVGNSPTSVSVADVDGDSDLDIAAGAVSGKRVSLLRNTGIGAFAPAETLQFLSAVNAVHLQDCDADLDSDLILVFGSTVEIHSNDGTGAFTKSASITGGSFTDAEMADMNGDGLLDLVATGLGLYVARAVAPGMVSPPQIYAKSSPHDNLAIADINGDGAPDVAATSIRGNSISTFWNRGNGTFADIIRTEVSGSDPGRVVTGDVDADGNLDVVISYAKSHKVVVLRGLGDGLFDAGEPIALPQYPFTQFPRADAALANMDADPDLELVITIREHDDLLVYDNDGAGHFALAQTVATSRRPTGVVLFDVDGDSDIDAVTLDAGERTQGNPAYVSVFLNDGFGALAWSSSFFAWADESENIAAGDVNGDLLTDIVITDEMSKLLIVVPSTGGGTFGFPSAFSTWERPFGLALADVDGDLDLDAVVTRNTPSAALLLNSGAGEFAVAAEPIAGAGPGGIAAGDIDGDGDPDFVIGCYADHATVLVNLGGGILAPTTYHKPYLAGLTSVEPRLVALADLDSDADLDIVIAESNRIYVLPNQIIDSGLPVCPGDLNGDGQVLVSDFVVFASHFGSSVTPNTSGDLNGDGVVNASDFTAFVGLLGGDCP